MFSGKLTANVFSEARFFFFRRKGKIDMATSNPNGESHEKNCQRSKVKTGRFYINLYVSIFTGEKSSHLPQVILNVTLFVKLPLKIVFLTGTSLSLLLDTSLSTYFGIVLTNIKTKLKQRISHYTEE